MSAPTASRRTTDLGQISAQRSGLFGAAILWIMLFHSSLSMDWPPLHLIKSTGYAGVDVFFLLSGIGLFYSMEKDPSPRSFYKKRAVRVLLPFLLVALVYGGIRWAAGQITGWQFLEELTLLSYWKRGDATYWFIAAILVFYAVYPLLYRVISQRRYGIWGLLLAAAFALAWLLYQNQPLFYRLNGFVFRIPVFLIGCFLAPAVKSGKPLPTAPTLLLSALTALVCWFRWVICPGSVWFLRMYLFIPLSISLTVFGSVVLSFVRKESIFQRFLLFFGGMTLELYLLHEKLLSFLTQWVFPNHAGTWEINGLAFLLTVAGAWCLHRLCSAISKRL